ncbi:hypothetical protein ACPB9J_16100 [Streptomyces lavendulocolor]|uniref:hypothetical protein n=1 Tax=Streptomyces lavendulocolor TaxID=67316 RepID=UPI003C30A734
MPSLENYTPHRLLRLAISDPGAITPRGDNYEEPLLDWQARAVATAFDIDLSTHRHAGFKTTSCVEIRCALCETTLDEDGDGGYHFATRADAVKSAIGFGWEELADGRVICGNDWEDDHVQARAQEAS